MELATKLEILADAAKYDASCASSGTTKRDSLGSKSALGSAGGAGICHSYAPDGRCISLLKILLTNACIFDCHYCINRRSSNTRRAQFSPEEVVRLTLDFYKRNYIEGLFLSSGIVRNPDYTMEQVVDVARRLRVDHDFRGYIHLKTIPEASRELIEEAGRYADRISINIELPTEQSLKVLAPEKNIKRTQQAMAGIRYRIDDDRDRRAPPGPAGKENSSRVAEEPARYGGARERTYAPAGQSTQMIIGADDSNDRTVLTRADLLYRSYRLRRVYYSAFSPIPHSSPVVPATSPPLVREHRLYQADWLLRFYGYSVEELVYGTQPNLDLELDPKLSWALRHRGQFPVDLNRALREALVRVPGLGVRNANRIVGIRRYARIRLADLVKLRLSLRKVLPFVVVEDHHPLRLGLDSDQLRARFLPPPKQLELPLSPAAVASERSVLTGEL